MSTAVAMSFPTGRFHATPWGHHVNEGLPEWPPSPWRLLRALVATWKRKLSAVSSANEQLPAILARLTAPPLFHLPPATFGHTRHFMPLKFPDRGDRTKVFDAFVALPRSAEVVFIWPGVSLTAEERQILGLALAQLGFFGRAESWCLARLEENWQAQADGSWARPATTTTEAATANCSPLEGSLRPADSETVRVLAADPATWNKWGFGSKTRRPDPCWNLLAETADLHAERWSDPPGSRWLTYTRPGTAFAPHTGSRVPAGSSLSRPTVARFALDGPVLPLVQDSLPVAEAFRRALASHYRTAVRRRHPSVAWPDDDPRWRSPLLSGKDAEGEPLKTHGHAYYLPTDEEDRGQGDGRIDHVTVIAQDGFGPMEVQALDRLRRLVFDEEELNLLLVGLGRETDFNTPLLGPATVWESVTPFLASRYPKARGRRRDEKRFLHPSAAREFAQLVLTEEIARLRARCPQFPEPVVEPLPEHRMGARQIRPIQFRRYRSKRNDDGGRRATGAFRLRFPTRVCGPICLGLSSHFGMGLFLATSESQSP